MFVLAVAKLAVCPSVRLSGTNMRWWLCAKTVIARNTKLSRNLPMWTICRFVLKIKVVAKRIGGKE